MGLKTLHYERLDGRWWTKLTTEISSVAVRHSDIPHLLGYRFGDMQGLKTHSKMVKAQ